jgi:hypothetical protein
MIIYTRKHNSPFQIDESDYEIVSRYFWFIDPGGCPRTNVQSRSTKLPTLLLGRAPDGLEWDHKNRDPSDNRRENLRAVTHAQNTRNRSLASHNTSGVTGVTRHGNRWMVRINPKVGERIIVGYYEDLDVAAEARRLAEVFYYDTEDYSKLGA